MTDLQGFGGTTRTASNDNQGYCLATALQMSNTPADRDMQQPKALVKGFGDTAVVTPKLAGDAQHGSQQDPPASCKALHEFELSGGLEISTAVFLEDMVLFSSPLV